MTRKEYGHHPGREPVVGRLAAHDRREEQVEEEEEEEALQGGSSSPGGMAASSAIPLVAGGVPLSTAGLIAGGAPFAAAGQAAAVSPRQRWPRPWCTIGTDSFYDKEKQIVPEDQRFLKPDKKAVLKDVGTRPKNPATASSTRMLWSPRTTCPRPSSLAATATAW